MAKDNTKQVRRPAGEKILATYITDKKVNIKDILIINKKLEKWTLHN